MTIRSAAFLLVYQGAKGGWQAHSPVLGYFGAGAGPRTVARNVGFTELLNRLCPGSTFAFTERTWRGRSREGRTEHM